MAEAMCYVMTTEWTLPAATPKELSSIRVDHQLTHALGDAKKGASLFKVRPLPRNCNLQILQSDLS